MSKYIKRNISDIAYLGFVLYVLLALEINLGQRIGMLAMLIGGVLDTARLDLFRKPDSGISLSGNLKVRLGSRIFLFSHNEALIMAGVAIYLLATLARWVH